MKPWSLMLRGTKTEVIANLENTDTPDAVKRAVTALLEPMEEVPGWTDPEPGELWEAEVAKHPEKFSALDKRPVDRSEMYTSYWQVGTCGHPDAHGVSEVRIEPVFAQIAKG